MAIIEVVGVIIAILAAFVQVGVVVWACWTLSRIYDLVEHIATIVMAMQEKAGREHEAKEAGPPA